MSTPEQPERRPAPRYGEYATPEEQRAHTRDYVAPLDVPPASSAPVMPTETPHVQHPQPARATTTAARPTRLADRIITFALLAYGLITVITAVPQLLDFTDFAETWMRVAGVEGDFTNVAQGNLWGAVAAWAFALGWLLTAVLSWFSLSRRRISWWIPMVGAIVTFVIVTICLSVPLLTDPAISSHFSLVS